MVVSYKILYVTDKYHECNFSKHAFIVLYPLSGYTHLLCVTH